MEFSTSNHLIENGENEKDFSIIDFSVILQKKPYQNTKFQHLYTRENAIETGEVATTLLVELEVSLGRGGTQVAAPCPSPRS